MEADQVRVVCVASTGHALPQACLDEAAGITAESQFPLTVGSIYVVYAATIFRGHCWFYVFDDNRQPYPVWRLAPLFDVADPSLPQDWVMGYVRENSKDEGYPVLSFPEWALDPTFYERLVDRDAAAILAFEARRGSAEAVPPWP